MAEAPTAPTATAPGPAVESPLDRARRKAYRRLLPLFFLCYVIAYVDRANVAIAKLTMAKDMPAFDNAVIGFGAGVFFIGYFLLEIPGTLIVEKWSARKWISRIMISWGIVAALTAFVKTPTQFYVIRFLLGLAEAGFFPGVIVYLTHWFPSRDRARALAYFFVATPMAQVLSPKLSNALLKIGTDEVVNGVTVHHPELLGLEGWQWVYIAWGIPAVILGVVVLFALTDRPRQAKWLEPEEREALLAELEREKGERPASHKMGLSRPCGTRGCSLLAPAYFFIVTGNYGVEFFLPSILDEWYALKLDELTWLIILPPFSPWSGSSSSAGARTGPRSAGSTRRSPSTCAAAGLLLVVVSRGNLPLTIIGFMVAYTGLKAYLPAFWSLPSLFLTGAAAAGSIGLINSVGNLGGFIGPFVIGTVEKLTGSFISGLLFLVVSMALSAAIVLYLGLKDRALHRPPNT